MSQLVLCKGDKSVNRSSPPWPVHDEEDERNLLKVLHSGKWWLYAFAKGKVLATALHVLPNLEKRIEARYLFHRLADYVRSKEFRPDAAVPKASFIKWFSFDRPRRGAPDQQRQAPEPD